jgi:ribosomal protein S12 methylthiotransferase
MVEYPRLLPYLDIPIQHVNTRILSLMNRRYTAEDLARLINRIRGKIPEIALRTTLLVGFPGETESDILQLEKFLLQYRFDHVGIFSYSNEEGCASENFAGQCSEEEKTARREYLLQVQSGISAEIQKKYLGRVEPVLIEGMSGESDLLLEGRTRFQAPDVDGCVYIVDGVAGPGDIVNVNITEAHVYDLVGVIAGDGSLGPEAGNA